MIKKNITLAACFFIILNMQAKGINPKFNSLSKIISLGSKNGTSIQATATDLKNNIYVYGRTSDTSGIASKGAYQTKLTQHLGLFVAKYSPFGKQQWSTYYSPLDSENASGLTVDTFGNVIISGGLGRKSAHRSFIALFDSTGKLFWVDTFATGYYLKNICADTAGHFFAAGLNGTIASWDGSFSGKTFIWQMDSAGNLIKKVVQKFRGHDLGGGEDLYETFYTTSICDAFGNFYVTQMSLDTSSSLYGDEDWIVDVARYTFNGSYSDVAISDYYDISGFYNIPANMNVDKDGNVYISTGDDYNTPNKFPDGFTTAKFNGDNYNYYIAKIPASFKKPGWLSYPLLQSSYSSLITNISTDKSGMLCFISDTFSLKKSEEQLFEFDTAMTGRTIAPFYPDSSVLEPWSKINFDNDNNMLRTRNNSVWKLIRSCNMHLAIAGAKGAVPNDTMLYSSGYNGNSLKWEVFGGTIIYSSKLKDSIRVAWGSGRTGNVRLISKSRFGCIDSMDYAVVLDSTPVWPGDANYDKVVDMKDVLNIGAAFGKTGPARPSATIKWYAQPCMDWKDTFSKNDNYKQADCDGDSTVGYADTLAISANYSKVHPKSMSILQGKVTDPHLRFKFSKDSVEAGDTLTMDVLYGSNTIPGSDIYGCALSVLYNSNLLQNLTHDFTSSWLSGKPLTMIESPYSGQLDMALVRTNRLDTSGYGKLLTLHLQIASSIPSGVNYLVFSFADNMQVNSGMQYKPAFLENDSIPVRQVFTGFNLQVSSGSEIDISPNPVNSGSELMIDIQQKGNYTASLYTLDGKLVTNCMLNIKADTRTSIQLPELNSGVYILKMTSTKGVITKKILVN